MFEVAHCLMPDEDRDYAFQRLSTPRENVVGNVPENFVSLVNNNIPAKQIESKKKLARNILPRFKNEEKISDKINEHVHDFFSNYKEARSDYVFSKQQNTIATQLSLLARRTMMRSSFLYQNTAT